jgi:hypothetical protein
VRRTFWEKATILHSEHHRPIDKPTPDRFSRHYAALRQDYAAMRDMYLSEPTTFDDILRFLADLERRINSGAIW